MGLKTFDDDQGSGKLLQGLRKLLGASGEISAMVSGSFWGASGVPWTARAWLFNYSSGHEPKRPFWAKSWPGAFWISLVGMNRNDPFGPNPGREPFKAQICNFGRLFGKKRVKNLGF